MRDGWTNSEHSDFGMNYIGHILLLAASVTISLVFAAVVVLGILHGRLKTEPSQPWIIFRKQPIKFLIVVAFNSALAVLFGVASIGLVARMLR